VPVEAFYIQASYFLTGETRSSLGIVKPNHPFDLRKGKFGTGAIEPFFRYEYLDIGSQVFTNGLADPNLWANRVFQTHVGVNWHLTQYIKLYFDWNHAEFNEPVLFAPGRRQKTSDMALIRVQIFF
jgi:phosphate-selective porin OprO and OprP